jgi:hypothetical protein
LAGYDPVRHFFDQPIFVIPDMETTQTDTISGAMSDLLDTTVAAFDQGQAATPREGASLIGEWFSALTNTRQAGELTQTLTELRDELERGTPTNEKLVSLLTDIADRTDHIADTTDEHVASRLTTLAQALRNFSGQLSTAV